MATAAAAAGLDLSSRGSASGKRSRKRRVTDEDSPKADLRCSTDAAAPGCGSPMSPMQQQQPRQSSSLSLGGDFEEAREDEEDEEDDSEDRQSGVGGGVGGGSSVIGSNNVGITGGRMDDERLKAFNLFVRFFVDENMDRMVPISKQPKDKLSGILEACERQFPEFSDRARKRVRTYLKACRRNGRKNGGLPQELPRTTPSHLTSATAEGILEKALAGERELQARLPPGRPRSERPEPPQPSLNTPKPPTPQPPTLQPQPLGSSRPERPAEPPRLTENSSSARPAKQAKSAPSPASSKDPVAASAPAVMATAPPIHPMVISSHGHGAAAAAAAAALLAGLPHGPLMSPFAAFASPFLPLHLAAARPFSATAAAATNASGGFGSFGGFVGSIGGPMWDTRERDLDWPAFEALFRAQMSQAGGDGTVDKTARNFREAAAFLSRTADYIETEQLSCSGNRSSKA